MGASQLRPARGRGPWLHWPLAAIRTRAAESRAPWTRCWTPKGVDLLAAVRAGFVKGGGQRSAVILSLLGAALTAAPAFAIDLSNGADFGGTYSCIGPGVASLPDVDVDVGPLGAGVYVEPGVAFRSPVMDYAVPASTWAPVYPQAQLEVAPDSNIDVGRAAVGLEGAQ